MLDIIDSYLLPGKHVIIQSLIQIAYITATKNVRVIAFLVLQVSGKNFHIDCIYPWKRITCLVSLLVAAYSLTGCTILTIQPESLLCCERVSLKIEDQFFFARSEFCDVYWDSAISTSTCQHFRFGGEYLADASLLGHPSNTGEDQILATIKVNRPLSKKISRRFKSSHITIVQQLNVLG